MTSLVPRKHWILIVEDDKDLSRTIADELEHEGYKVLSSPNATDAVRMLTNQKFDCVIMDLRLERGLGEQVVMYVKRDKLGFNFTTPILVISGELSADVLKKIKDSVVAFFVKPFDLVKLVEKVKSVCKETPAAS